MSTIPPLNTVPGGGYEPTTRVDTAHAALGPRDVRSAQNEPVAGVAGLGLLKAIAGHDPQAAAQQLRGQALELATLLRDKQRLLEQRESELNARAALLESDLRAARLRRFQDEAQRPVPPAETQQSPPPRAPVARCEPPSALPLGQPIPAPKSAEVHADSADQDASEPTVPVSSDAGDQADPSSTSPRASLLAATELTEQFEQLEQQRQELRQREEKLERRGRHVEQMHDEVTQLHREALELRLASEQVWADLKEDFPREELSQTLAAIRAKLADNYRLANDMLARRKDELHELRAELNLQEQRLRQQRRDLQMWADRRYDEIESRLAKIIVRERELDQLESQFQRQSIQWQQQRQVYRQEIEQLSWQLHERSAG